MRTSCQRVGIVAAGAALLVACMGSPPEGAESAGQGVTEGATFEPECVAPEAPLQPVEQLELMALAPAACPPGQVATGLPPPAQACVRPDCDIASPNGAAFCGNYNNLFGALCCPQGQEPTGACGLSQPRCRQPQTPPPVGPVTGGGGGGGPLFATVNIPLYNWCVSANQGLPRLNVEWACVALASGVAGCGAITSWCAGHQAAGRARSYQLCTTFLANVCTGGVLRWCSR